MIPPFSMIGMQSEVVANMKFDELMKAIHTEGIIGTGLIVALFLAIYFNDKDLAVNIASGLIGYLGRGKVIKE